MLKRLGLIVLVISGCSTVNEAVFVTKTSISVAEIDTTPSELSFGYQRVEGFYGPNYENGAVPPVVAFLSSNGEIFNPQIKQIYATGDAAKIVTNKEVVKFTEDVLTGDKKSLLFGTSTSLGFKLGVSESNPTFLLGYRRKEASFIPIHKNDGGEEKYSSVLASIDTTIASTTKKFKNVQFFATGDAAKNMANKRYMKKAFDENAKSYLQVYDDQYSQQKTSHSEISGCAFRLSKNKWQGVLDSAISSALVPDDPNGRTYLKNRLQAYLSDNSADNKLKLLEAYIDDLSVALDADSEKHGILLEAHKNLVCGS